MDAPDNVEQRPVDEQLVKLDADLYNVDLPRDDNAYDKIKLTLTVGVKISWYYKDEKEFWEQEGMEPRKMCQRFGIVVPASGVEVRGGELDADECVVIDYWGPVEKCYPECVWIAMKRLLDAEDLVEIFQADEREHS